MDWAGGRKDASSCHGGSNGAHLHGGSAIEREGFDLPVLQENLQYTGNEEESFFLQHVLACGAGNEGGKDGGHGETEGEREERMNISEGVVMAPSTSQGYALRHVSLEKAASLLSHQGALSWSNLDLPHRFPSPAPSSCRVNGASHTVWHMPELCPCLAPCPTLQLGRQWHRWLRADPPFPTLNLSLAHLNLACVCAGIMVKADSQEPFQSDNYLIDFGSKI